MLTAPILNVFENLTEVICPYCFRECVLLGTELGVERSHHCYVGGWGIRTYLVQATFTELEKQYSKLVSVLPKKILLEVFKEHNYSYLSSRLKSGHLSWLRYKLLTEYPASEENFRILQKY
jgi:hypothetical protein